MPATTGRLTTWQQTTSLAAGIVLGLALTTIGLVTARADIAALGAPALLGAVWAWTARPPDGEVTADFLPADVAAHARTSCARGSVSTCPTAPPWSGCASPVRETTTRTSRCSSTGPGPSTSRRTRRGPGRTGCSGWTTSPPTQKEDSSPPGDRAGAGDPRPAQGSTARRLPLPHQLDGLTGPHTTRRLGDGTELRDIHPFAPGDRLRRIDWRATARRSPRLETLYVRRTHATAEATVVLVLDSRDEVGPDVTTWEERPAAHAPGDLLDIARDAAASVAQTTLDGGDRVGLEDLGRVRRPVPRRRESVSCGGSSTHSRWRTRGRTRQRMRPPQIPRERSCTCSRPSWTARAPRSRRSGGARVTRSWRSTSCPRWTTRGATPASRWHGGSRASSVSAAREHASRGHPDRPVAFRTRRGERAGSARSALELAAREQRHGRRGTTR
ncbi:DUF58 domain-containing protein [Oerskovia sp. M15]